MAGRLLTGISVNSGTALPPFVIKAGALVVLGVRWNTAATTVVSVTDSAGNTYTRAGGVANVGGTLSADIWYKFNATAGTNVNFTITFSGTASARYLSVLQLDQIPTVADPFDVVATGSGTSTATATTGAFSTAQADEVLLHYFTGNTLSGNWTHNGTDAVTAAHDQSAVQGFFIEYPTAVLSGVTRTVTRSGATSIITITAAFKADPASGGGGGGSSAHAHASFGMAA